MRKLIIPVCTLAVLLVVTLHSGHCLAQERISGGKSPAAVTKPEVIAAADFAIMEKEKRLRKNKATPETTLRLVSIVSAEEQVVSGMNYHLKLKVTLDGKAKQAGATVWWQAWNKEAPYRLTSWTWQ